MYSFVERRLRAPLLYRPGRPGRPDPTRSTRSLAREDRPLLYFRQLFICHSHGYRRTSSLRLLLNKAIFLSRIRRTLSLRMSVPRSEVCEVSVSLRAAPRPTTKRLYDTALCYCISRVQLMLRDCVQCSGKFKKPE